MVNFGVIEKNGKFVVTKNNEPILLPKSDGAKIVTEFDNKVDAEKYLSILKHLTSRKTKV
ncbi:MAG: hypothetical protein EBQ89_01825 [Alphaproteobacteria bacterium]|jgi:hypothetical protein|nr:hypothetical protein [Alphaproteobacteria bacterium]